ncbi:1,4-alpha-glucan branching protein domain-containing protein [Alicyclobacillus acidiphilus]|uniref:1,4-alpha-glucan branching protein domain-containing protein n=1 Tax=Alicyclobacillus acidiphilus TaxID=182455 RepID=UPI0008342569|nr:1,4-alpha-glucan branching protein domain-containing protein [Alicyclobacillus acidiphilus]
MTQGYLNLVLHAHLPFVRHVDRDDRLEERWLFEALTESYIPLIQVFQQLLREEVDFRVTLSLSPPLLSMLSDGLLQSRYRRYLQGLLTLAASELDRTESDPVFHGLAEEYQRRFTAVYDFFDRYHGNILTALRELLQSGKVELITSAATHAFLPYIDTDEALRAQIATAVSVFEDNFGTRPRGIWLPECAYTPRVLPILREYAVRYFFVDHHAFATAQPAPVFGIHSPIVTDAGIAAFARDEECSRQVWSSEDGYPGDYDYREYYRDIGFDLDLDYLQPFIHPEGIRFNTGFKYYRITGRDVEKQPYDFLQAREKAALHAGNFLFNRQRQIEYIRGEIGRLPIVTAPYDAELFGHWWYEGPIFIDMLLRKMHYDQDEIATITPSEYLDLYEDYPRCQLSFSTWGRNGYGEVWLNGSNDWIYPALHECEHMMRRVANRHSNPSEQVRRALNQAARELMLAQSSDWAFIMDTKTAVDYAVSRTKQHVNRCIALLAMVEAGEIDTDFLSDLERIDNLFPSVDYQVYRTDDTPPAPCDAVSTAAFEPLRILVLSWEFPPMSVGGLARHVYDLSRQLASQGCEVHVVTTAIGGYPLDETIEGVHVHRVRVRQPDGGEFIHFAFQLNLMMLDRCCDLIERDGLAFDLIHAHDWLVAVAAKALKQSFGIPVVATIHATEHGRNHGIFTDTHRHIHHREWVLTYEAERVIVCSSYMCDEVAGLFQLPSDKVDVIPNGVDKHVLAGPQRPDAVHVRHTSSPSLEPPYNHTVLFVGRLVREKGVQYVLEAAPSILEAFPNTQFVIVGKGPMFDELVRTSEQLMIRDHVVFYGYAEDEQRNELLRSADVAIVPSLYEPFGIVALEAMAAGTPVVVSDVGGLADIVQHGHNGLKAYPGDAHSIAEQVKRLLRDSTLRDEIAQTATKELSRFDWMTIADQTMEVYQKVIRKPLVQAVEA